MKKEASNSLPVVVDFSFEQTQVRTMVNGETGEVYVCLSDLLKAMGTTTWPNQVLPEIEEVFGKGTKIVMPLETSGGIQNVIFISEHAAAFVISRGRTEVSKRLNRWLFAEVLPTLRKTGSYSLPGASTRPTLQRAGKAFAMLVDTGKKSGLDHPAAVWKANAAVRRTTGIDLMELLRISEAEINETRLKPVAVSYKPFRGRGDPARTVVTQRFWLETLQAGRLLPESDTWMEQDVPYSALFQNYLAFARRINERRPHVNLTLIRELKKLCPGLYTVRMRRGHHQLTTFLVAPSLDECRAKFEAATGTTIQWKGV